MIKATDVTTTQGCDDALAAEKEQGESKVLQGLKQGLEAMKEHPLPFLDHLVEEFKGKAFSMASLRVVITDLELFQESYEGYFDDAYTEEGGFSEGFKEILQTALSHYLGINSEDQDTIDEAISGHNPWTKGGDHHVNSGFYLDFGGIQEVKETQS